MEKEELKEVVTEKPIKKVVKKKIGVTPDNCFVNVRYRPSFSAEVLTLLKPSSKVTIISSDKTSDFHKISIDGQEGYVFKELVEVIDNE